MRKLTRKQQAFADKLIAEPKISAVKAALEVYGKPGEPTTYRTADQIAMSNLENPRVMQYLNSKAKSAENVLVEVMNKANEQASEHPGYASVARQAAGDILDRVHGKPTTKIEATSTSVTLTIDLAGTIATQ